MQDVGKQINACISCNYRKVGVIKSRKRDKEVIIKFICLTANYCYRNIMGEIVVDRRGIGRFLFETMTHYARRTFQIDAVSGRTETYASTHETVVRVALEMKKRGIEKNDVVVVCCGDNMRAIHPIFATLYLNAIVANLDKSMSVRDTSYLLGIIDPKMIFVDESSLKLIEGSRLDSKIEIVVMGDSYKYSRFSEFLKSDADETSFVPEVVDDEETALIFFSSGTTGMPKPICCSHFGFLYSTKGLWLTGIDASVSMHFSSFYWISALLVTFITMFVGGMKVIAPAFELDLAMKYFRDHKVTFAFLGSVSAYNFSKQLVANYDTSNIRCTVMFGGNTVTREQMEVCQEFLPNSSVYLGYGQTEVSGAISVFGRNCKETSLTKPNSCGNPIPGVHVKVVNPETNETLGPNEMGEIRVLTRAFANGYYNVESSGMFAPDGYLKTGDVGYLDDDDCLYVCDRIKEMFKYMDWHIVPSSIERVIHQHPAVKEAIVIGVPHPTDGEHPMAIVTLKENFATIDGDEIANFVNRSVLEREKLRGGLRIAAELPKTPTGKINRKRIREMVKSGNL